MALHPNAGGVLIVGLGCENNQPDAFRALLGDYDTERIRFMVCQYEEDEMESGMTILRDLYARMVEDHRTEEN
jgi:altronate hydrolase